MNERIPGSRLVHPLPAGAAALIVVNDLWLKAEHPGLWSGKLSDVGICFLLPVILVATIEWLAWTVNRRPPRALSAGLACTITAVYFTLMQLSPTWVELHRQLIALITTTGRYTRDPSDLLCLVFCGAAFVFLKPIAASSDRPK